VWKPLLNYLETVSSGAVFGRGDIGGGVNSVGRTNTNLSKFLYTPVFHSLWNVDSFVNYDYVRMDVHTVFECF
jgi:hypothetical protein